MSERSIFIAALDLDDPRERDAFLSDACAGDTKLHERIRRLLETNRVAGDFLAEPAAIDPAEAEDIRSLVAELRVASGESDGTDRAAGAATLTSLGDYRILRPIGHGGMGTVYEAVQESLGRRVALKVTTRHAALDPRAVERFQREIRSAARLHHSNIVPVYEGGAHDGAYYFAMQFIDGRGLDEVIDELRRVRSGGTNDVRVPTRSLRAEITPPTPGPDAVPENPSSETSAEPGPTGSATDAAPPSHRAAVPSAVSQLFVGAGLDGTFWLQAARIGLQVADALAYAHRERVLHRDVEPANLLLDHRGTIWVTDFGVAKSDDSELTRTGEIVGTVRFMAPERFRGVSDERGDVYGLGMTLYELLTLQPAFDDTDRVSLLRRVEHEEPLPPRRIAPRIPHDLETVVLKAIAKDPSQRYASAALLADDLRSFLADRPIQARRTTALERAWRWCRRNGHVAILSAAVSLLLLVIAVGAPLVSAFRSQRDRAVRAENEAQIQAALSQSASFRRSLFAGTLAKAERELHRIDPSQTDPRLTDAIRDETLACLARTDFSVLETIPGASRYTGFDSTFEWMATAPTLDEVVIKHWRDDTQITRIRDFGVLAGYLRFTQGGRYLAIYDNRSALQVYDRTAQRYVWKQPRQVLTWHCDGSTETAALAGFDKSVSFWDLSAPDQDKPRRTVAVRSPPVLVRFSPDGRTLAIVYSANSDFVDLVDVRTGEFTARLESRRPFSVSWSPNGKNLAVAADSNDVAQIEIWDVGRKVRVTQMNSPGHQGPVPSIAFDASGDYLVSISHDGTARLWHTWTGTCLSILANSNVTAQGSDDGRCLGWIVNKDSIELLGVKKGRLSELPFDSQDRTELPLYPAVRDDNRIVAIGSSRGVQLLDLTTNKRLATLPSLTATRGIAFRNQGSTLLVVSAGEVVVWPLRDISHEKQLEITVGPPRIVPIDGLEFGRITGDGKALFFADPTPPFPIRKVDLETGKVLASFGEHPLYVEVLPHGDGDWIATETWHHDTLTVWDTDTQTRVAQLPVGAHVWSFPSPHGRYLCVSQEDRIQIWDTQVWKVAAEIPKDVPHTADAIAFSADERLLATRLAPDVMGIIDLSSQKILARIADPDWSFSFMLAFSPDGRQLIDVSAATYRVRAWNLGAMREELRRFGLDWHVSGETPPDSSGVETDVSVIPISVTVDAGELAKPGPDARTATARIAALRQALQGNPEDAAANNALAWALLTALPPLRSNDEAVSLAERAFHASPQDFVIGSTLGLAYYRTSRFAEAEEVLAKNLSESPTEFAAFDLIILSMVYHELQQPAASRVQRNLARRMRELHPPTANASPNDLDALFAERAAMDEDAKDGASP